MKKLLLAALLASAIAAPAYATELVVNGGFEDTSSFFAGWDYVSPQTTLSQASNPGNPAIVHGGIYAADSSAEPGFSDSLFQTLKTVKNQTYDYSFWLSGDTSDVNAPSDFYVQFGLAGFREIKYTPTTYTHFTGSFVADDTSTELYIEAYNSLGFYLLDDVSVTSRTGGGCVSRIACDGGGGVPEPAAWAMMLLGFGGIGAMLRRRSGLQTA